MLYNLYKYGTNGKLLNLYDYSWIAMKHNLYIIPLMLR